MPRTALVIASLAFGLLGPALFAVDVDPTLWDEGARSFFQDGPGLLLTREQRDVLGAFDSAERQAWIDEFLARDPIPETPANELRLGIEARRRLVYEDFLSWSDERARLLFLHGRPDSRDPIDCDMTFHPLEIWRYGPEEGGTRLVLYEPSIGEPYRLWLPLDSKRVLYTREMAYWLEEYEELRGRIRARRFDYQLCDAAKRVDNVTGVSGLSGFEQGRATTGALSRWLDAPADLAGWARAARATEDPAAAGGELRVGDVEIVFPEREGQRMLTRLTITLPPDAGLEPFADNEKSELRVNVEGVVELRGKLFEDFKVRYQVPAPETPKPVALVLERLLRPGRSFVVRAKIRDEVGGRETIVARGFAVPREPTPVEDPPVPEEAVVALAERLVAERIPGRDGLVLVPPETDVVLGLWRAEALVSGERIAEVTFLVDGTPQLSRSRAPWSAEVRLDKYPTEQVVRAEGYDAEGELVAADEIILNQQRGELEVRITEPERGRSVVGPVEVAADVVVPEERRVAKIEVLVNGDLQATVEDPPWRARVDIPERSSEQDVTYLTVVATLDDGTRAEDVRFLSSPTFLEEVDVDLVELYTTVTDRSGRLIRGLEESAFEVLEDGRKQTISKFELVEDLPLTLGIAIDTSGSMIESLGEARRTAMAFLRNIITPKDQSFAVSFANTPRLMMPRTSDVGAVEETLEDLRAVGMTSLYDAVITSLYYFRGVRGRRALVLLSDGEDTSSTIFYRDTLEYARRSGVAIYSIGLDIGRLSLNVRSKLGELSQETGGRSFFISRAEELEDVYEEIELELRSQYLIAYTSDRPPTGEGEFRTVTVEVQGRLKARTIQGYYP
jgi:VWFA-related protein